MKWSEAAKRRVAEYLAAVEKHLAHKPAGVRQDVVAGLRSQIAEALQRLELAGGEVGLEVVERVLADMDPPETFAEAAVEAAGEAAAVLAPQALRSRSGRWFALGLAFLLVNTYGVWKWTSRPAVPQGEAPAAAAAPAAEKPVERILRLRRVEQINVSPARELMLQLVFSETPDRHQLTRFFTLRTPDGAEVPYRLAGQAGTSSLVLETDPVLAEKVEYRLEPGLPALSGGQPADQPSSGMLTMEMNLALREVSAETPPFETPSLRAEFNAFPEANNLREYVAVEPAVDYTVEVVDDWEGNGLVLRGAFRPGEIYEVAFKEGLPAANGASLPQTLSRTVQFPLPGAALRIEAPGRYLAPGGALSVPVAAVSLREYTARLKPVFPNNLVELARRESDSWYYENELTQDLAGAARVVTNALPPSAEGAPVRGAVALRSLADGEPRGVYWLEVSGAKVRGEGRLLVVTDLGIAVRAFPGGALAWVSSLRSATPAAGAAVTVYARNNQVLARGTADERGLAKLEWTAAEGAEPFLVTAELAGDLSYVDLARTRVEQGEGLGGAAYLADGALEAAVFTERGVYRPGETVFVQALVRDAQLRAPEPFPAVLRVRRPDGRVFRDLPVVLDEWGSATAEVALPDFLPTGRYGFELALPGTFTVLGQATAALEDFVPPQIRVQVTPPERGRAGDLLAFGVKSAHLFGRAAAGLKASGAATFKAAPFAPSNWPGWTFGDDEKAFASVYRNLGTQTLDENGQAAFEAESRAAWRPPAALEMVQQATVLEASGRGVTAYGSSRLDAYPFYIGLKAAWEGAVRAGETQRVAVVEVLPDGAPVAEGKPLVLSVSRVTWNSVLRRNSRGRYEWKSERQVVEIRRDTLAAGGAPQDWAFAVDGAGEYTLAAADPASGASTRISFYAGSADAEWAAWSREQPGRVELAWDRERYVPGQIARLQVRAPFAGTALLTIETDRVREARLVTLEKNTAEFEVVADCAWTPNAYVTLTLIRPARAESVWSAHRASGAIPLRVVCGNRDLEATLAVPADIRPQTELAGTVTVTDAEGQPVTGQVTVLAVDEGICSLTAFQSPDPRRIFNAQRALGVAAYDLYGELMPVTEEQVETTPAPGGDSEDGLRKRLNPIKANRFKPVALWQAALPLDANGQAQFRLPVPEFSGELRLMAVACNREQLGATSTAVKVKRDLIVQPALPRFLATGDRCEAAATLLNESTAPLTVQVRVTCGGPLRAETADASVEIPAGGSRTVALPLVAGPGPGKALCTIEAEAGAESFRDTIEIAVRPAAGSRVAVSNLVLAAGETAAVAAPADWLPESVSAAGALSALPSLQLGRALDYVVHYPYGCLEQTVSGAFPLLQAGAWARRLLPGSRAVGDVQAWVPAAIARVLSMQQENGSFALWPYMRGTDAEASLYAAHFLVEAQAAGFAVPADNLKAALDWVRGQLDRSLPAEAGEAEWRRAMQTRAYQCHVLALAGRPDAGWNARLVEQADKLNFAAKAHAASALLLAGEPRRAVELMESLALPPARGRTPGGWSDSPVRDAALLLAAWLEVDPAHPAVGTLAQYLRNSQRDGHWGTTQNNAFALLAFGKLARHLPDEEQPFAGTLTLPGGETRAFAATNDVTWSLAPGQGGAAAVSNAGPGKAYLWTRFEGVAATPEATVTQGVALSREFLDLEGRPLDPGELRQGDLCVVRLTVTPQEAGLDQLVIEDLLPAGWEIENPNLATAQQAPWLPEKVREAEQGATNHREARDDRMLIFTGGIYQDVAFHYAVRAVTPGTYALPPATVSGMYDPEIRGVAAGGQVRVVP